MSFAEVVGLIETYICVSLHWIEYYLQESEPIYEVRCSLKFVSDWLLPALGTGCLCWPPRTGLFWFGAPVLGRAWLLGFCAWVPPR